MTLVIRMASVAVTLVVVMLHGSMWPWCSRVLFNGGLVPVTQKKKKKRKSVDCVVKTLMGKIINLGTNDVSVSFQMVPLSVFDAFCQMSSVTAFGLN